MKVFELPVIEVKIFNVEDVITTSSTDDDYVPGGNQTPGV